MWIKILLALGLAAFAVVGLVGRQRAGRKALRRLAIFVFGAGAVIAVLDPAAITWVANRVGVGRGTDLVLYVLVIAFLFTIVGFSARFSDTEDRLVQLARSVALSQAAGEYGADLRDQPPAPQGGPVS